nr:hypothetical protein CFP56_56450 [Quercus suber]
MLLIRIFRIADLSTLYSLDVFCQMVYECQFSPVCSAGDVVIWSDKLKQNSEKVSEYIEGYYVVQLEAEAELSVAFERNRRDRLSADEKAEQISRRFVSAEERPSNSHEQRVQDQVSRMASTSIAVELSCLCHTRDTIHAAGAVTSRCKT